MKFLLLLCATGPFFMAGTALAQMPGAATSGCPTISGQFVVGGFDGSDPSLEHQTYGFPCTPVFAGAVILYESNLTSATDPSNWSDVLIFTTGGVLPQPGGAALTATYISDTEDASGKSNGITDADLAAAGMGFSVRDLVNVPNNVYLREVCTGVDNLYDARGPDGRTNAYDLQSDPAESDFLISASPHSLTLGQGTSGTSTISTAVTLCSAQTVFMSVSGLPTGATASFSPASVTSGGSSTLTINAGTAATGTYTVTITGAGYIGSNLQATHTTTVSLTITAPVPTSPKTWGSLKARYR